MGSGIGEWAREKRREIEDLITAYLISGRFYWPARSTSVTFDIDFIDEILNSFVSWNMK